MKKKNTNEEIPQMRKYFVERMKKKTQMKKKPQMKKK